MYYLSSEVGTKLYTSLIDWIIIFWLFWYRSEKRNDFTVSINVAAEGALSFNLTYEELLKRHNGYFENAISISPRQVKSQDTIYSKANRKDF